MYRQDVARARGIRRRCIAVDDRANLRVATPSAHDIVQGFAVAVSVGATLQVTRDALKSHALFSLWSRREREARARRVVLRFARSSSGR